VEHQFEVRTAEELLVVEQTAEELLVVQTAEERVS